MYTARDTANEGDERSDAARDGGELTRAAFAYGELKRRLLVGDFRLGSRLAEVAVAAEFGVSRTPIREALSRLHVEGLVVRFDEGGYGPAAPDLHTIKELYEVRRGLELLALERMPHDRTALHELADDWRNLASDPSDASGPEFVLLDEDFHVRLAEAAGNRALVDMLVHVNERIRIVRMHDFLTADRVAATIAEHTTIVEAVLDDDGAVDRLTEHLELSERIVEQRAAHALSRMISGDRQPEAAGMRRGHDVFAGRRSRSRRAATRPERPGADR